MISNQKQPDLVANRFVRRPLLASWKLESWILGVVSVVFLTFGFMVLIGTPRASKVSNHQLIAIAVVVLGASLMQALFEYRENPRDTPSVQSPVNLWQAAFQYGTAQMRRSW